MFVNVTVPGPLNLLHATVRMPVGRPSSVAVPASVAVDGNVIASNGETVVQLALAGMGIARVSEFAVGPAVREGKLVSLLQDSHHDVRMPISAVYLHPKHVLPKVRVFVDFLLAKFQPKPPWEG